MMLSDGYNMSYSSKSIDGVCCVSGLISPLSSLQTALWKQIIHVAVSRRLPCGQQHLTES